MGLWGREHDFDFLFRMRHPRDFTVVLDSDNQHPTVSVCKCDEFITNIPANLNQLARFLRPWPALKSRLKLRKLALAQLDLVLDPFDKWEHIAVHLLILSARIL